MHKTVEVIRKKVESEPPENLCPPEGGRQLIGSKFLDPKKMDASHKNGIAYFEPYHWWKNWNLRQNWKIMSTLGTQSFPHVRTGMAEASPGNGGHQIWRTSGEARAPLFGQEIRKIVAWLWMGPCGIRYIYIYTYSIYNVCIFIYITANVDQSISYETVLFFKVYFVHSEKYV